jgi:hypothetical protein
MGGLSPLAVLPGDVALRRVRGRAQHGQVCRSNHADILLRPGVESRANSISFRKLPGLTL